MNEKQLASKLGLHSSKYCLYNLWIFIFLLTEKVADKIQVTKMICFGFYQL